MGNKFNSVDVVKYKIDYWRFLEILLLLEK